MTKRSARKTLQNCAKDITYRIDELQKHYRRANQLAGRLPTIVAKQKARQYRRCRFSLGREIVRIFAHRPQPRSQQQRSARAGRLFPPSNPPPLPLERTRAEGRTTFPATPEPGLSDSPRESGYLCRRPAAAAGFPDR